LWHKDFYAGITRGRVEFCRDGGDCFRERAWESADYCKNRLGKDKPLGSIDPARLNVNGSSLALGHPFGATGTRIVASLAKLLEEKGSGRGLISICTAGGMGVTAILERP